MTLHHLPQSTHPLGFDWLIPREGIDEGYLVETRRVSRHHTTIKVDTLSSTRFHSTRVTPPLLFLLGIPTWCNLHSHSSIGYLHNLRSIYDCIACDRSEYIPGSGSHLRSSTPSTCSLPEFLYVANTSIQTVVKGYYSSSTT